MLAAAVLAVLVVALLVVLAVAVLAVLRWRAGRRCWMRGAAMCVQCGRCWAQGGGSNIRMGFRPYPGAEKGC